jgi:hypothetical protein
MRGRYAGDVREQCQKDGENQKASFDVDATF